MQYLTQETVRLLTLCVDLQSIISITMKEIMNIFSLIICQLSEGIYKNTQKTLGAKFYEISDSINFFDNKIN